MRTRSGNLNTLIKIEILTLLFFTNTWNLATSLKKFTFIISDFSFVAEQDGFQLVKTLSCHLLKDPYCNGSTTATFHSTVPSPRECLSISQLLPSVVFYSDPPTITSEVHRLIDTACNLGEDEIIKLTNALCKGIREPAMFHREFHVNVDTFEEEVYFSEAAVTIATCRLNPEVHNGYVLAF